MGFFENIFRKCGFDLSILAKQILVMLSTSKIKCPRCKQHLLKKILLATHGKCNNCGYTIAGAITNFVSKPASSFSNTFSV